MTGSVAAGIADRYSDVELNIWDLTLPPLDARLEWLRRAGATDLSLEVDATSDGTEWTTCRLGEIWIELGWQTIDRIEQTLDEILAGNVLTHDLLLIPWMLRRAVPFRSIGRLSAWRERAAVYPEIMVERLIDSAVAAWVWPSWVDTHWALVDRGETLALTETLVDDVQRVLRILFAVNRAWEPNWKWVRSEIPKLRIKPTHLENRTLDLYVESDLARRVALCLELVLDALALVPPSPKVSRAQVAVRESLLTKCPR